MDKDRVVGTGNEIKGSIKVAVGKLTGDTELEIEGQADRIKGKAQNLVGTIKDTLKP